jgi:hypothetical protein
MAMNDSNPSRQDPPIDQLALEVDGRQVRATLARFPSSGNGPRRPRWMLQIDGGAVQRGPLTWEGAADPEVERAAIASFVRERQEVASKYRETHGELLQRLYEAGRIGPLAHALGVPPGDLVPKPPGAQGSPAAAQPTLSA